MVIKSLRGGISYLLGKQKSVSFKNMIPGQQTTFKGKIPGVWGKLYFDSLGFYNK